MVPSWCRPLDTGTKFIGEHFKLHYPHHAGHFARVIDNQAKYREA